MGRNLTFIHTDLHNQGLWTHIQSKRPKETQSFMYLAPSQCTIICTEGFVNGVPSPVSSVQNYLNGNVRPFDGNIRSDYRQM